MKKKIQAHKYPGNKGSAGSYQNIINEFPLHQDFISGMAGSGAMEKRKLLAPGKNIVFEINQDTISILIVQKFKLWEDLTDTSTQT